MGLTRKTGYPLKQMAENVGLEEDEYVSLLELFVETSTVYVNELREAIRKGDSRSVYETTHTIRGAAENLYIPKMSEIAKTLELRARQNILEGAQEVVEHLTKELAYLRDIVHEDK